MKQTSFRIYSKNLNESQKNFYVALTSTLHCRLHKNSHQLLLNVALCMNVLEIYDMFFVDPIPLRF